MNVKVGDETTQVTLSGTVEYQGISYDKSDLIAFSKLLLSKGPKAVVVTLGSDGALTMNEDETIKTSGIKVRAVDTTAAGDCFIGAFATQIEKGRNLKEALDFANQAAAISVQRWGASSSLPFLNEIIA